MGYKDIDQKRKYAREWVAKRRLDWFADKICLCCGSTNNLQLDHKDPKTKISHSIWSWAKERREDEISKCQVLCRDCHLKKTISNKEYLRGESHPSARLTETDVKMICVDRMGGMTITELAKKYSRGRSTIFSVVQGRSWSHVNR